MLDPRHIVETRTAAGGAAPPVVEGMAADCARQAGELRVAARTTRDAFTLATARLLAAAAAAAADQKGI